ncbi:MULTISPECIES: hypothetical protein [Streptomyces]|uniref:NACHT domain-containing protein n=1 Tax=Streptomyces mirabilis TaxID=68239 RepID=A0ABU3UAS1_9ACTN|nr:MULTISPECIES: hypothetical protein [Streptomyces]MCX4615621.1 hypothetical protein [Streptomyces mirabilis]MCX5355413.1 hypothetical protein [Streptomyces mirabilis]MDU8991022.1 hypothetical protein [Streptomyces mirabilis]
MFLSWVTFRSGAERAAEQPLEEIAEHLAQAVRNQWETEVQVRRVNDPYPMTVRWRAAPDDLVESWPLLQATAGDWPGELGSVSEEWVNSPAELEGSGAEITRVLTERVPTQRLLVLGGPGAGKTVLLSRLVLGLLHRRMTSAAGPHTSAVPVLFPLATWNPTRQDLYAWMAERLASDYPTLAEPAPKRYGQIDRARGLLGRRLILPVVFMAIGFIIAPDADNRIWALLVGPILGVFAGIVLAVLGWLAFDEEPRRPASGMRWAPNWPGAALLSGVDAAGQAAVLAGALWLGLTIAFTRTVWGSFSAAKFHRASRHRIPRNLMAFLADAHQHRGVLRQVGAVYQFRHIDLQRHLARAGDDG